MAAPIVSTVDSTILLNTSIEAADLFTASDPDNDPITHVRFRDLNGGAGSGYFSFNGVIQPPNTQLTFSIADLGNLLYFGGNSISSEMIEVSVRAGGQWSSVSSFFMYSVVENLTRPIMNAPDLFVVQNEFLTVSDFVSFSDPDGWPAKRYRVRDRNGGVNSGYFQLNGVKLAAGTWHYVNPEDWNNLRFYAAISAPNQDKLDFRGYDAALWSFRITVDGNTTINANRPVVLPEEHDMATRARVAMGDLFTFTDVDGNTAKAVRFLDTSPHAFSGYLTRDGVQQPSKVWVQVAYDNLDKLEWVGANKAFVEQIRAQVWDGRHWSKIATIRVKTDPVPLLGVADTVVFNELEEINVNELFTKIDDGPAPVAYQVYDSNSSFFHSGQFRRGTTNYSAHTIHEFTPLEYRDLVFKGGVIEDRSLDEIYVRSSNGTFWSDWTRLNARTEPHMIDGLATLGDWNPFVEFTDPIIVTYSFMDSFPAYGTAGEADANTFVRPWGELRDINGQFIPGTSLRDGFREMFNMIETSVNIDFQEVADSFIDPLTFERGGKIRLGTYCNTGSGVVAYASPPGPNEVDGVFGDQFYNRFWIGGPASNGAPPDPECFFTTPAATGFPDPYDNESLLPEPGWLTGSWTYEVMLHETGHSLGLKHSFTSPHIAFGAESTALSAMSYSDDMNSLGYESMGLYDIAALQSYYGAPIFNDGDTVYDSAYFGGGDIVTQQALWDSGGTDTIDLSHSLFNNTVTLREGTLSDIDGYFGNIGITFGTVIENAIGGIGADTITGNESVNMIMGGDGNDIIEAYGGNDWLSGERGNDRFLYKMSDGHDTIDEDRKAGRDRIEVGLFLGLDDFAEDLSFSKFGNDLFIDFTIDQGPSRGSMHVTNQKWGGSRIETLEVMGVDVDLDFLYKQFAALNLGPGQRFEVTTTPSNFGFQVAPVT